MIKPRISSHVGEIVDEAKTRINRLTSLTRVARNKSKRPPRRRSLLAVLRPPVSEVAVIAIAETTVASVLVVAEVGAPDTAENVVEGP